MLKLKIDNKEVTVPEGVSVMAAARMKGFEIPSMCYREGKPHFTSCMICMVKDKKNGKLFPSCSVKAVGGMEIITRDDEIEESRQMALELLLSEHTGDCEAPCQLTCPAHMDIPLMNRLLAGGEFGEALKVVRQDIAMPSVLGRICPAPCEGACRRKSVDSAVSICLLKRYAGDFDIDPAQHATPEKSAPSGKRVVIIGAGTAGLAVAYYLQLRGHQCIVFDRNEKPGGSLWNEVKEGKLETEVLQSETAFIEETGVVLEPGKHVHAADLSVFKKEFDAILIATGSGNSGKEDWGLKMTDKGVEVNRKTYETSDPRVFAAGSAIRFSKLAIRTLGQGKEAAFSIDQFLAGKIVTGEPFLFNSRFGKLFQDEVVEYIKESNRDERIQPVTDGESFTREEVMQEAARCLHCDCRAIEEDCKLRMLSHEYGANQKHYWSEERKHVKKYGLDPQHIQHEFVIYEPNKCIKCGRCVHITEEHREKYGMSYIGRGFDVVINVPFNESLQSGLAVVADQVVEECPTGALSKYDR